MVDVSVLMAVHADTPDKVTWLGEAVDSVLEQDFQGVELIVVDDHSPLDVGRMDARVVRTSRKQGPAAARNTAAALARSDALLVLDADDVLADPGVLSDLFSAWSASPKCVIYGDLQQYSLVDGEFQRGRTVVFPHYNFQQSLDPKGLIAVTAMHSKECHIAAGGWKTELSHGLEDVEYWIAAGAAGYCGLKIDRTVLLYRQHGGSRTSLMRRIGMEGDARSKIYEMHVDLYEGRYPMGCCGGGSKVSVPGVPPVPAPTSLTTFSQGDMVWARYNGGRTGAFGMVGPATRFTYTVEGTGHVFQVHVNDIHLFRRSGRGQDFSVGVAPPAQEPELDVAEEPGFQADPPTLAEIERLDDIAVDEGIQEVGPLPEASPGAAVGLSTLDLGSHAAVLEAQDWTVEKLAAASVSDLTPIRGIGIVTAARIIDGAKVVAN